MDYEFKFFYDKNLSNEFVSTGTTSTFSVAEGVVSGVTSSYTITYNKDLPTKLYYSFEKDGVSIKPDGDVVDSSKSYTLIVSITDLIMYLELDLQPSISPK